MQTFYINITNFDLLSLFQIAAWSIAPINAGWHVSGATCFITMKYGRESGFAFRAEYLDSRSNGFIMKRPLPFGKRQEFIYFPQHLIALRGHMSVDPDIVVGVIAQNFA
jgi:hypothetical protein